MRVSADCAWRSWGVHCGPKDSCWTASICFRALSQAVAWRPHWFAKDVDRMWWGAGTENGMRKQESREMQSANGVAHSASGMSWENRAASLMGNLLQQFDWKPSQPGLVSVWNTMFSPAAMWSSWKVVFLSTISKSMHWSTSHKLYHAARASGNLKTWSFCSDLRELCDQLCSFHAKVKVKSSHIQTCFSCHFTWTFALHHTGWCACRVWH